MVALPVLAGALLRVVNGVLVDRIGPKRAGLIGQAIVIVGLLAFWGLRRALLRGGSAARLGPRRRRRVLRGRVAARFALVSAALSGRRARHRRRRQFRHRSRRFVRAWARRAFGWINVIGLAAIPLTIALVVYVLCAQGRPESSGAEDASPTTPRCCASPTPGCFMFYYAVTFGGFSGLASSLSIYFNTQYRLDAVTAGYCTAACVFAGSLVRPIGGAIADRLGGVRVLTVLYAIAAAALVAVSFGFAQFWLGSGVAAGRRCWRSAWATAPSSNSCRSASASRWA